MEYVASSIDAIEKMIEKETLEPIHKPVAHAEGPSTAGQASETAVEDFDLDVDRLDDKDFGQDGSDQA